MYPIFISYRRSDLSLEAEWIYNVICTFFEKNLVFFDKQEIEPGKRWDETLRTCVSDAYIVLILIGPKWLTVQQPDSGRRRLDDPEDWVGHEIRSALKNYKANPGKRWIFSILLNGARLPKKEWLPIDMAELPQFQIEKELQFDIKNYLEAAFDLYTFIGEHLAKLENSGLIAGSIRKPFNPKKVPNPYDLPEYPLPEDLRVSRPKYPFKGLEYFKREDARIFFGRRKETGEIIDLFKKSQSVIRLYGQSGVGKSSLMYAGLFPRLESNGWIIKYVRRNSKEPLGQNLKSLVTELKNKDLSDSLIILDQVEEIITNPNIKSATELADLATEIQLLSEINSARMKPIRLILCYRKEYDVEIKNALRDKSVLSNEYWLKDMDEAGMREAIHGITLDQDLMDEYHFQIEKGLEDLIIDDLLVNEIKENGTPLLQILLRKMWDRVSKKGIENRILTIDLYKECKSNDLPEFLDQQLKLISAKDQVLNSAVDTGLALDVLKSFTTESDTASARPEGAILDRYSDVSTPAIKKLLQAFVDFYLLVRLPDKIYRLPHDSLVKAVRIQYNNSLHPGQRAARLLDSKKSDIETRTQEVEFSKPDLAIIDAGIKSMRKITQAETMVIEQSRKQIQQHDQELEEKNKELRAALKQAKEQTLQARAKALAANAREMLQTDPAMALRLAEAACKTTPETTKEAQSAFFDVLKTEVFYYKNIWLNSDSITSVAVSPDGKTILTGSYSTSVRLWSTGGTVIQTFEGHTGSVSSVAFSPDGKFILTGSRDYTARLWTVNGKLKQIFKGHTDYVNSVAFSPDGKSILTGSYDKTARLWSINGKLQQTFPGHSKPVYAATFSPDGKSILTGSADETARLWLTDGTLQHIFTGHKAAIYSLAFSPDGMNIITGSWDSSVRLWSLDGTCKQIFEGHTDAVYSVAFSPDGKYILSGSKDKTARLWLGDGTVKQTFDGSKDAVYAVAFSPDGNFAVTGSRDKSIWLWSLQETMKQTFEGHRNQVYSAAFSPDAKFILTGSADASARLWSIDGTLIQTFGDNKISISAVAFSPDGKTILTGSGDNLARIWLLDGTLIQTFTGHQSAVKSVAFSPNGKFVLTGSRDNTVRLWSVNGTLEQTFSGHEQFVNSVAFSPDGKFILSGSYDKTARLWTMKGKLIRVFQEHQGSVTSVAYSPDGKFILTGCGDNLTRLWSTDGTLKQTFEGHKAPVNSVAFSPDGKFILTGSGDKTARLWPLNGKSKKSYQGHNSWVNVAVFSPDGKYILTGSGDKTAKLWLPFWEIIRTDNLYIPSAGQIKEFDIPEDMEWGKIW